MIALVIIAIRRKILYLKLLRLVLMEHNHLLPEGKQTPAQDVSIHPLLTEKETASEKLQNK